MKTINKLFGLILICCFTIVWAGCPRVEVEPPPPEPFTCDDIQGQLDFSAFCGLDTEVHFSRINDDEGHCLLQRLFTSPESEWDHSDLILISVTEYDATLAPTLYSASLEDPGWNDAMEVDGIGNSCIVDQDVFSGVLTNMYFYFYKGPYICFINIEEMDCLDEEDAFALAQQVADRL